MGFEKHKSLYHHCRIAKALTILEMLIAITLSCALGIALYYLFFSQDRIYSIQSEISEMQQNLRAAMEKITRDLTMAGFAQPPWTTINGEGGFDFYGAKVTGGSILDVVGSFDGARGVMKEAAVPGATELKLKAGDGDHFNAKTKSDISIGGRENAKIIAIKDNTLTIDTDPGSSAQGLRFGYPVGTEIYLVKWKTYWVDTSDTNQPILRVDEHVGSGSQQLAHFITGLEIALSGKIAEVTITARTRNPDKTTGLYARGQLCNKIMLRNVP